MKKSEIVGWVNQIDHAVTELQEWRRAQEEKAAQPAKAFTPHAMNMGAKEMLILRDLRDRIRGAKTFYDKFGGKVKFVNRELIDETLEVLDQIFGGEA